MRGISKIDHGPSHEASAATHGTDGILRYHDRWQCESIYPSNVISGAAYASEALRHV
jgi:hypothetical protein